MVRAATARRHHEHLDVLTSDVGQRIREARLERGMSLAQLGGEDLTRSFLSLVERGKSRISLRALALVAERLDLPLSYFLEGEESEERDHLLLEYAELALEEGRPMVTLSTLEKVPARLDPDRIVLLRARAMVRLNQTGQAVDLLKEYVADQEEREGAANPEVLQDLGSVLYRMAVYDEALTVFRRAIDIASTLPDNPMLLGKLTGSIGHILYVRGDIDGALAHYERAGQLFHSVGDLRALGALYAGMSRAYNRRNDLRRALRYAQRSVHAFQARRELTLAAREMNTVALHYWELGDIAAAERNSREAVDQARAAGDSDTEALALSTLAAIHLEQDDVEAAEVEARRAVALAKDSADVGEADGLWVLARLEGKRGNFEESDRLHRQVLDLLRETGRTTRYGDVALEYSAMLKDRGEVERAYDLVAEALSQRSPTS